jgi:hypothetical protein
MGEFDEISYAKAKAALTLANSLAGTGRTTENVKANADAIAAAQTTLADMANKVMPVVYSTTLAGAANAVTITTDNNGQALNLKRAILNILVPAGCNAPVGTTATVSLKVNDVATGYRDVLGNTDNGSSANLGGVRNVFGLIMADLLATGNDGLCIKGNYGYSDGTTRTQGASNAALVSGITGITKIYFALSGGYTLPAGTMIELRGSKA